MNNGVSGYLVVQLVVGSAENCFKEDNMYKEKGLPIMIDVQIVRPSTEGGRKRAILPKTVTTFDRRWKEAFFFAENGVYLRPEAKDKWGRMRIFVGMT